MPEEGCGKCEGEGWRLSGGGVDLIWRPCAVRWINKFGGDAPGTNRVVFR